MLDFCRALLQVQYITLSTTRQEYTLDVKYPAHVYTMESQYVRRVVQSSKELVLHIH